MILPETEYECPENLWQEVGRWIEQTTPSKKALRIATMVESEKKFSAAISKILVGPKISVTKPIKSRLADEAKQKGWF